jgi:hypothetical protein
MAIAKQDFYEGAALNLLARAGAISGIANQSPFYVLNEQVAVLMKYSTKVRSPWGFTVTENELEQLHRKSKRMRTVIGLICGADGVVCLSYDSFKSISGADSNPLHIACYRRHGEYYEVSGPAGVLGNKIAPSSWSKILDGEE